MTFYQLFGPTGDLNLKYLMETYDYMLKRSVTYLGRIFLLIAKTFPKIYSERKLKFKLHYFMEILEKYKTKELTTCEQNFPGSNRLCGSIWPRCTMPGITIMFGVSITTLSMKKLSYAYFMTHFVYTVKWHIGNVFNKPPRQNAPTDRVLTSVILKEIEWAFRKVYPTKIPGMVHQGLLAPQSLQGYKTFFML